MSGHEHTEIRRALIRCDGALPPKGWEEGREIVPVTSIGARQELNLHVTELGTVVLRDFNERATDLVRIAAYVFAADQLLSKGGQVDPHRRRWRRDMAMVVPVLLPEFWQQPSVNNALCQALGFATDDFWSFAFVQASRARHQLHFEIGDAVEHRGRRPDSVVMFSGGMDSLCAMVEAVTTGLSPIAVSHRASIATASLQRTLAERLRERFPDWAFPHLHFQVHQRGKEAQERTRRTRGFLFASIGAAVAGQLDISKVLLSDNGYVSANPAINAQLVGALSSRGTHPTFLRLVNELLARIFPDGVTVENSLMDRTRAEALEILKAHDCADLIGETRTCANSRSPNDQPHCGVCSQCVDRRFATIHAGLETVDPAERYRVDIFQDAIPEGIPKTFAVSYVGFARRTANITPDDLVLEYPEFDQCLDFHGPNLSASADRIHGVISRHANEVIDVLARKVTDASRSLAQGILPPGSLVVLASGASGSTTLGPIQLDQSQGMSVGLAPDTIDSPNQRGPNSKEASSLVAASKPAWLLAPSSSISFNHGAVSEISRLSQGWLVTFDDEKVFVRESSGFPRLVTLLKAPHQDVPALDLMSGSHASRSGFVPENSNDAWDQQADDVIDDMALRSYEIHARHLKAQRDEAIALENPEDVARIDQELKWLTDQIRSAKGKGGRRRKLPSDAERARVAVSKSVNSVLHRLEEDAPKLSSHLRESVRFGYRCRYEPQVDRHWVVRSAS